MATCAPTSLTRTPLGRLKDGAFASAVRGMTKDVRRAAAIKQSADMRLGLLQTLFDKLDVGGTGAVEVDAFVAKQAGSAAEADELRATFETFDGAAGAPDGMLTFRKFVNGTLRTPLGRLRDAQFEAAVSGMIEQAESTSASGAPATSAAAPSS